MRFTKQVERIENISLVIPGKVLLKWICIIGAGNKSLGGLKSLRVVFSGGRCEHGN
jgi:hypothetical protein